MTKDLRGFWDVKAAPVRTKKDDRICARIAIRKQKGKKPTRPRKPADDNFTKTLMWRQVRYQALKNNGARCQCCGATSRDGVQIHVDHIKPRATHPNLALSLDNLQILCDDCNIGKGSWDDTDWRAKMG